MENAWTSRTGACRILIGDCIESLRSLPSESVQCCITSPPYWGLRDYGHDGQIGLEKTPEEYVAKMVDVFREVRRVLRDDGTLWLNLGDSYNAHQGQRKTTDAAGEKQQSVRGCQAAPSRSVEGLKPKDLVGIPWRVAFALQADGWWLRQDIIWHKPNPMPESVTDRCTKAHEYIFLLAKSERYYYDHEAVKEAAVYAGVPQSFDTPYKNEGRGSGKKASGNEKPGSVPIVYDSRNRRSVWTVSTKPYSGAHFATYPPDLIEPCVKAGCPEGGTILDPFNGSGTTGAVAVQFGRRYIGCEINPEYVELAKKRIGEAEERFGMPLFL